MIDSTLMMLRSLVGVAWEMLLWRYKPKEKEEIEFSVEGIGEIDLSALDVFEDDLERQAIDFEMVQDDLEGLEEGYSDEIEDFSFAMLNEAPDLTNI